MEIRKSKPDDLGIIMEIYEYARKQMKLNGNPTQWGDKNPAESTIIDDIKKGNSYVIEENEKICGVFSFIIGDDPTYKKIEGNWKNEDPYGTVHRVASNGTAKGVLQKCLEFCEKQIANIRIDTHNDNKIMQHLLEKYDYEKCGIIYVEDGSPRIAYQKVCNKNANHKGEKHL